MVGLTQLTRFGSDNNITLIRPNWTESISRYNLFISSFYRGVFLVHIANKTQKMDFHHFHAVLYISNSAINILQKICRTQPAIICTKFILPWYMHYTKVFFKHRYTLHCITGFSQLDIFCLILIEEHFCYLMRDSYSGYIFLEGGCLW